MRPEDGYGLAADPPAVEERDGDDGRSARGAPADHVTSQRVVVEFDFPVCFTQGVFAKQNSLLVETLARKEKARRHRFAVLIDSNVAAAHPGLPAAIAAYAVHHRQRMELVDFPRAVPGGERCKTEPDLVVRLQEWLVTLGLDRQAFVVAIGGGALLDLAGYVAATLHRGIRLVRLPTTVLAQNDAGIGVKNGINGFGVKNVVGTFAPPFAVINDSAFLSTLTSRDRAAGMAEAIKVALIRDPTFFRWLEREKLALRSFQPAAVTHLIRRCADLHLRQITDGGDPFERGSGRPLDFGHWAAHKLESLTDYEIRHGEAVAVGIALDSRYSVLAGLLPEGDDERICALIEGLALPTWHDALEWSSASSEPAILRGLAEFREHLGGELTITLLSAIGRGVEVRSVDGELILQSIAWLRGRAGR